MLKEQAIFITELLFYLIKIQCQTFNVRYVRVIHE